MALIEVKSKELKTKKGEHNTEGKRQPTKLCIGPPLLGMHIDNPFWRFLYYTSPKSCHIMRNEIVNAYSLKVESIVHIFNTVLILCTNMRTKNYDKPPNPPGPITKSTDTCVKNGYQVWTTMP